MSKIIRNCASHGKAYLRRHAQENCGTDIVALNQSQ